MKVKSGAKMQRRENQAENDKEIDIPFKNVIVSTTKNDTNQKSEKSSHKKLIIAISLTILFSFLLYFILLFPVNRFINKAIQSTSSSQFQISTNEHDGNIFGDFSFYGIKISALSSSTLKVKVSYAGGNISIFDLLNDAIDLNIEINGIKINSPDISSQISLVRTNLNLSNIQGSKNKMEGKIDLDLSTIKLKYKKNISMLESIPEITIPAIKFEGNLKNSTLNFNPIRSNLLIKDENKKMNIGFVILNGKVSILHDGFINLQGAFHPSDAFFQKYPFKELLIGQGLMDSAGNINFYIQGNMKNPTFRIKKEMPSSGEIKN